MDIKEIRQPRARAYMPYSVLEDTRQVMTLYKAIIANEEHIVSITHASFGLFICTDQLSTLQNIAEHMKKYDLDIRAEVWI